MPPMPEYIYLIHPFRDGFFEEPTAEERAVMDARRRYLQQAAATGTVLLSGLCLDHTFGLVVFRAADEAAAQAFMHADPAVQANVMMAELHPFRPSPTGRLPVDP